MEQTARVFLTNIQRFSLDDGPGIRSTVFLKGCDLCCPWCCNPENISFSPQPYKKNGIEGIYGRYVTTEEIVAKCLEDESFYVGEISEIKEWNIQSVDQIDDLPGGVTFSGGEALLQVEALRPVCQKLHCHGIHIAVETCLFIPKNNLLQALEMVDLFYIDVKILDRDRCTQVENGDLGIYLENIETFFAWRDEKGVGKPVVFRIPVIGGYTDDDSNRYAVKQLISKYKNSILKIELIKEHHLAKSKYESLGMKMCYKGVDDCLLEKYKLELFDLGIPVEVCKI